MFDVITNLKGLQGRFTRLAATCDPLAWRNQRQETPWFHRGLGTPPAPFCLLLWSHLSREIDETTWNIEPNTVFQTSVLHSSNLLIPFQMSGFSPCLRQVRHRRL